MAGQLDASDPKKAVAPVQGRFCMAQHIFGSIAAQGVGEVGDLDPRAILRGCISVDGLLWSLQAWKLKVTGPQHTEARILHQHLYLTFFGASHCIGNSFAMAAMEMFSLGSRSLNHSSADTEAEYDRLRDLARQEAGKRSSCFDRAHQAYESGDGARAHELSEEGKQHAAKMEQYNRQARDFIFRANNESGRVAGDTIDLHGLYVEEAEDVLEERIKAARQRGETHLHVIVGKGNHSTNHVQKIKPRVEQVCRGLGLQYKTEANEGRIYVNLQGGSIDQMPPPPQAPSYGGYPGQHGGQQHGGQNQQQGQDNNDEIEQMVRKGLPKLLKKLGCCTVM
ncbi:hypothetical protein ACEQ8H_002250 [Pleosporales sp. CAS-2024a]